MCPPLLCILRLQCGQLILRKISKIGATRYHILRLKCPNLLSAGALPQTSMGELTVLPQTLAVFKGATSKGREKERE